MKPLIVLAHKLNVPMVFTKEWERSRKLHIKGQNLILKGRMLQDSAVNLYRDRVIKEYGEEWGINWNNGEVTWEV